ncbi:MAG: ribonuclease III [Candidatus Velthaea sp.]
MRALLKRCGAGDVEPQLVEGAFVHESAARERGFASNERLEFLGDAILGDLVARYLFARYPAAGEGELSRRKAALVSGEACALTARKLGFGDLVILGQGAASDGGADNTTILGDAFEAFVAAFAAATDAERTRAFVEREHLASLDREDLSVRDAKTALQEFTQGRLGLAPVYIERAEGPPHDRRYTSQVRVGNEVLGEGIGPSKKAAQQSAAAMALATLAERTPPEAPDPAVSNTPHDAAGGRDGQVIAFRPRRKPKPKPKAPTTP